MGSINPKGTHFMALLKQSDPETALQKSIDAARTLHHELETRLAAARKVHSECEKASNDAHDHLADRKTLDARVNEELVAERHVMHGVKALDDSARRLADLEKQLATTIDQRQRREAFAEEEADDIGLGQDWAALDKAMVAFVARCEKINGRRSIIDDVGVTNTVVSMRVALLPAVEVFRNNNRSHAASILNGAAPMMSPRPALLPQPVAASPPLTAVFSLRPIAWTSHDGTLQTQHALYDCELPPAAAARALRIGAACSMSDPRRKTQRGYGKTSTRPQASTCVNLDSDAQPEAPDLRAVAPVAHSAFEKPIVGPAFNVRVPRNESIPANASRNLGEDKP